MPPLLQVKDLQKDYALAGGHRVRAVAGVSLEIEQGQTLGLVGESGCGKSTLGRCVLGLERPTSGQVIFQGVPILGPSGAVSRTVRRSMQYIFQDPHASLNPRMTVERIVSEPLEVHRLVRGREERRRRVTELLRQVGLTEELLSRFPHEFSGGQRQRIAIARALASGPRFVVADEPTSSLDVPVRVQILSLLQRLQQETGLAYLFISHDLQVVRRMASRVAVMYLGRVVEQGAAGCICQAPLHPYTQALVAAAPTLDVEHEHEHEPAHEHVFRGEVPSPIHPPPGCPFHPRCPVYLQTENSRCTEVLPGLLQDVENDGHLVACHERGGETAQAGVREPTPTASRSYSSRGSK